jgi:uncharacterized protein
VGTTVAEPDHAALVAAALDGDKAAFAALVTRHRPMLVAVCRRGLGDAELAEDAAQEAVLAEAAEDARLVLDAVAALPPGQRAAVRLHYLAGLTQAQTAARVGTSVGAVKVRLHQARVKLRERLGPWHEEEPMPVDEVTSWVEMRVVDVRRGGATDERPERHVVLLEEVGGDRRLWIWVGPFEGTALAMGLREVDLPRPMTYRFAAGLLAASRGTLREVRVTRLVEGTYYAEAVVDGPGGEERVDARPSDALGLALVVGAPVRVDPAVIETAEQSPLPWREPPEELPADAAQIVSERLTDWERSREAMAKAREQGSR